MIVLHYRHQLCEKSDWSDIHSPCDPADYNKIGESVELVKIVMDRKEIIGHPGLKIRRL